MTLARRIVNALAALYAYAMAPDDYTPEARRATIAEGDIGMEAAKALEWLEDWMAANPGEAVELETSQPVDGAVLFRIYVGGPLDVGGRGAGIVEAIADAMVRSQPANPS